MNVKNIGITAFLVLVVAGAGFFWWNQGSAGRAEEKMDLAVKYICDNDFEKAILAYNEAIKIDPKAADAYQGLGKIYTMQGQYDKAAQTYEKGLAAVAPEERASLQMGLAGMYVEQGKMDEAENLFRTTINSNPACVEAYWGLAMVCQQQGDNKKAEAMLREAIAKNPNEYRPYNFLALFLSQNGQGNQAFEQLVTSLSLEVNQQEAYLVLSDLFQPDWAQLLDKLPGVADQKIAAMLEFYSYYAAEDYQNAVSIFESKLSQQADNHKAQILAAIALIKTGNASRGQDLIAGLADKNVDGWLLSDIAEYYLAAGDQQKARSTAIHALGIHGTNLEAVALLQRLNANDEDEKIYTAAFLLYNWRPISEVENILTKSELKLPFMTPDASVLAYILENYPNQEVAFMVENSPENKESILRSYYRITRADLTGDEQAETIVTGGGKEGNAFVLQPQGDSYRLLLKKDGYVYKSPSIDKYGNMILTFAFSGTGALEETDYIFRWDGKELREIWSGEVKHYNYMEIVGSYWFEETGSYTISGNKKPEHLKYVLNGQYGHVVEFGQYDSIEREETITKEYTFNENQFKFIETSSDNKKHVIDEKLALLTDAAKWAEAEIGGTWQLEPPYGNPGNLDLVVCVKEINGDTAMVGMGEYATDNGSLYIFKRNPTGKWVFDSEIESDY